MSDIHEYIEKKPASVGSRLGAAGALQGSAAQPVSGREKAADSSEMCGAPSGQPAAQWGDRTGQLSILGAPYSHPTLALGQRPSEDHLLSPSVLLLPATQGQC